MHVLLAPALAQRPAGALTEPLPTSLSVSVAVAAASTPPPENLAVTLFADVIDTVHVVRVPEHAPLQPRNFRPADGFATSVTVAPGLSLAVQTRPQTIPPPVTVPFPETETESVTVLGGGAENVAVTVFADVIETLHVGDVPLHAPPQPVKVAPAAGVAVRVTVAFCDSFAVHVAPAPQAIPPPLTVPLPLTVTVSVVAVALEKLAVTALSAFIGIVHVATIPVQLAPFQPMNVEPAAGVAVSVIDWPSGSGAEHGELPLPQLITPAPVPPVTVPLPATVTLS